MDEKEFDKCRATFVKMIKEENFYINAKQSVKQNWAGKRNGFADHGKQKRFEDIRKGWEAALKKAKEE